MPCRDFMPSKLAVRINKILAQLTRAVEYTDCIFAVGYEPLLPNEHPVYDTKQSDDKVPVILELWGMWSTSSLPSLPGPLWSGMVAPDIG